MSIKEVNSKKFDAIMKKRINLGKCPKCPNIGGEIIIPMICFGSKWRKVYIRCNNCGFETKSYDANTVLTDTEQKRFGNFVIDKSLMNAIHNAVNDWNGEMQEMENSNSEEIIKALKCCTIGTQEANCRKCPLSDVSDFTDECQTELMKTAFALIKSQEQRIKELAEENERLHATRTELTRGQEENARLKIDVEVCGAELSRYTENIVQMAKQDRADTAKKLAERLKSAFPSIAEAIDYFVKDLLEGE